MNAVGVYVVRLYRRDALTLAGVVESVESGEQLPFHSTEQLWRALHKLPSPRRAIQSAKPDEEDMP
ncbi:MAG TPA: hypothetical protein VNM24_04320 [Burkholderiales bacterium]|jgi:hypothetical protein|nr:hypothetical protein [Burkholderiales bacterium]